MLNIINLDVLKEMWVPVLSFANALGPFQTKIDEQARATVQAMGNSSIRSRKDVIEGQEYDGTIYVNRDDLLRFEFDVFYKGTEVTAKNLPHNVSLNWRSNDGFTTVNGSTDVNNFGRATIRIPLDSQQWIRNTGILYFESLSWAALLIAPVSR